MWQLGQRVGCVTPERKHIAGKKEGAIAPFVEADFRFPTTLQHGFPCEAESVRRRVKRMFVYREPAVVEFETARRGHFSGAIEVCIRGQTIVEDNALKIRGLRM